MNIPIPAVQTVPFTGSVTTTNTTHTTTAELGVPLQFGPFVATAELRFLRRRLQQAWYATGIDGFGYACEGKTEWRDVPTVQGD